MPGKNAITILALGDVIGKPGRKALAAHLSSIVQEIRADFVLVNGENASGGLGLRPKEADELLAAGASVLTTGNHIWRHKEIRSYLDDSDRVIRPANYPWQAPGRGWCVASTSSGAELGVLNLQGLLFMDALDCPFVTSERAVQELQRKTKLILVDFHAEATSEKRAMGHYLDGKVTAVFGTHTHIPTADAEVMPGGTGYLTDLGMCGPTDSVIGVRKQPAIERFITKLPTPFQVASDRIQLQGAIIRADASSGRCLDIQQRSWKVED